MGVSQNYLIWEFPRIRGALKGIILGIFRDIQESSVLGFANNRGTIVGVLIIRVVVFGGLYGGSPT